MKLNFYGADRCVTGSCHCLEANGKRILIDCGLQQGGDELDNSEFMFNAADIDYCIVTHAHIDHSGRLPLLVKRGYDGDVICSRLTAELMRIMLLDSAHIQESDAEWENRKGKRAGRGSVEPLYTSDDASAVFERFVTHDYNEVFQICDGIRCRFTDAGHLLGSSFVELWITEDGNETKVVFSGDIGNVEQPIIRDPSFIDGGADYVVMESTYGDRSHEGEGEYTYELAQLIRRVFSRGGNIIIPAFAVGRTQELLYFLREIKEENMLPEFPDFPVYVDSPLATAATQVFCGDLTGYLDAEAMELVRERGGRAMLSFPGLRLTETTDESRSLNTDTTPKIIISASGMCDAGRIRHHLKHNLWRKESAVVFVGYQAQGSLGRMLLDGRSEVKLFGEDIAVRAEIINFPGLSSHADHEKLVEWAKSFLPAPKQVFVVHGDADVAPVFADELNGMNIPAHAPELGEVYDLTGNVLIAEGHTPAKKAKLPSGVSAAYSLLVKAGQALMDVIERNKGGSNGDLGKFADEIKALAKKWYR